MEVINDHIFLGSKKIDYQLFFKARRTLGITINPEMEITVNAPIDTPVEKIREKVKKKAPWIIKQLNFFLSFQPRTPERKYVGGETHLYLGRQYRLQLTIGTKNEVRYKGRFIEIVTKDKSIAGQLMKQWYREKAKEKFAEIAEPLIEHFKKYQVAPKGLYIQDMPTRWGSCTAKGRIILNPELVKAPRGCIEYVIIHELCHLVYHNHTAKFMELQAKEMPDWEKWKQKLEVLLA